MARLFIVLLLFVWPVLAMAGPRNVEACGLYAYRAEIVRVVDGDTVIADIDLGFHTWRRGERLRLIGIDAPEPRGATRVAGRASGEALRQIIEGRNVTICTEKDRQGKFGRYLAWIFLDEAGGPATSVNAWLVRNGFARPLPAT